MNKSLIEKMNSKVKLILAVLLIVAINAWNRYGNFKQVMRDNGVVLLQYLILLFLIGLIFFLIWKKRLTFFKILVILIFGVFPLSYLLGNAWRLPPSFLIIYPVSVIACFVLFRRELLKFL